MIDDYKLRIKKAVEKFNENLLKESQSLTETKKYDCPERKTQHEILKFARSLGWSLDVVDAKNVWDYKTESYSRHVVASGFSDLCGCNDFGHAIYIEVKAPKKRSTLRDHQREFLLTKINKNCFAVCSDGVEHLNKVYLTWLELFKNSEFEKARSFLIADLPCKKDKPFLFD